MQIRVIETSRAVAAAVLIAPLVLAFPAAAQNAMPGSTTPDTAPGAAMSGSTTPDTAPGAAMSGSTMPDTAPGPAMQDVAPGTAAQGVPSGAVVKEASRGEAAQGAGAFIDKLGKQGLQVLGPSVPQAQRAAQFRQLIGTDFDLAGISRFVLGPHGRQMSPAAQQEFQSVFREFLAQSYSTKLTPYGGAPFRVTGERPAGNETVVTSQATAQGKPVEIAWHVINHDGRFLITDVAVDGVSMKTAQREEFARIIERNGGRPETLVAVLKQQLAQAR